ncbi:gene 18.5 [Escherichia phage T7]|uniref:Gene 18.5 n=1 Tax=Escherichia phage T7 TaxID=10760 RepID=Q6WYC0_BPT7|nr:gene 18.5 [Escherichia phage T7]AAP34061.1 gene 18.5 [Escherichia phage T7]
MLEFLRKLILWVLAGMLFGLGWHLGSDSMDAKWKQEVHNEYVKRVEAAKSTQRAIDAVSAKYQEDLAALEGSTDRIISDLRSDNKRLRVRVKTTGTFDGQCGFEPDGRAELDDRDVKRILAVTQKGDAWIRALQDIIRELQRK